MVELDDSPGTTNGTKFSVLQRVRFPFLLRRGPRPPAPLIRVTVLFTMFAK